MKNFRQTFAKYFFKKNQSLFGLLILISFFQTHQLQGQCATTSLYITEFVYDVCNASSLTESGTTTNGEYFVLNNQGSNTLDVSGFEFDDDGDVTDGDGLILPAGTTIPAGGALVVSGTTQALWEGEYGTLPAGLSFLQATGSWQALNNTGDDIAISNGCNNGSYTDVSNQGEVVIWNGTAFVNGGAVSTDASCGPQTYTPGTSASAATAPEINIQDGNNSNTDVACGTTGTSILNAGSVNTASGTANITIVIQNTGTADLNITDLAVGGTDASDFTITTPGTIPSAGTPLVVSASSSTNVIVSFDPSADGARAATLTITNDDGDEASCVVPLNGTGTPTPVTPMTFDALPDCDDAASGTGTSAADNSMYVHFSNLANSDGSNPTTFTSSVGTVSGNIATGATSGTILITGLSDTDYGTILTLTGNNNGNTASIEIPVVICGFSVQTGGNGQTPNSSTNGTFCATQNGITAPGILVEAAPTTALSSGNNIASTYVYVLVNTTTSAIVTFNNSGLFSATNVINDTDYTVYAFNVDNADLTAFQNAITPGTTAITDLTGMGGSFASLCYSSCWNVNFSPSCFICPTISALTATSPICSGTATTDLAATIANFFGTENNDDNYDVEFVYTTTQAANSAAVYALASTIIGTEDVTMAGITSVTEGSFTLPTVTTQTTYYIYARILDASTEVPDATCRPFAEAQVVVNPLPVLTAQTPTICADENPYDLTSLQNAITSATGTFAYTFGGSAVPDPTMFTASNNDIVTVTFTDGTTSCVNETTITFTVNPLPTLTAQTPTICANDNPFDLTSLQSSITSATGTFIYTVAEVVVPDPTMYTATSGDVVVVNFFDGTTSCLNSTTITFTVNPLPTANIALAVSSLCSTSSGTTLTISGTAGAQVIYSIDGVNQTAITIEGDGSNDIAVNPSSTTVYALVSVTNTTTTCSANLSESVTLTITDVSCSGAFPWNGNN